MVLPFNDLCGFYLGLRCSLFLVKVTRLFGRVISNIVLYDGPGLEQELGPESSRIRTMDHGPRTTHIINFTYCEDNTSLFEGPTSH